MTSKKGSLGSYGFRDELLRQHLLGSLAEQFLAVGSLVLPTRKVAPSVSVDLPSLISAAGALPNLELGPGGCRPNRRIQTHYRCICPLQRHRSTFVPLVVPRPATSRQKAPNETAML